MQYILLIYGDEKEWDSYPPEAQAAQFQAYEEYTKWLADKGWIRAGDPLHGTDQATTVRVREGKLLTTDGPFAETKEQLGGYYIVECENLDQAIEAASKVPAAQGGSIEIRPIMPMEMPAKG
jgi:hypothetical protein